MNFKSFIPTFIIFWACMPGGVLRADLVEDFIGKLFGQEGGSQIETHLEDELKKYDPKLSRSSTQNEIEKSFRALAKKYHSDKTGGDEAAKEAADEQFKAFSNAFEPFKDRSRYVELQRIAQCIKFYSYCVKGAAVVSAVYGMFLVHTLGIALFSKTPHMILTSLYTFSHGSIDMLLSCSFDRYAKDVKSFSLADNVNLQPLLEKLPVHLSEYLTQSVTKIDQLVASAYDKIAWRYYD